MKKLSLLLIIISYFFQATISQCQQPPVWTRNMITSPDSARLIPVKTLTDLNSNIFVLNFYRNDNVPAPFIGKIHLNKFDTNGNLLWNLIFDNNGSGNSRGLDMAIDDDGNCFIAGGNSDSVNTRPLIMKINPAGIILWQRDSTLSFNDGKFDQVIFKNNLIYIGGQPGIAVFDTNGIEQWSHPAGSQQIAVDNLGRLVSLEYPSSMQRFDRYDFAGNLDFSDSTIIGERIAIDSKNNYYLLSQYPGYELEKFDSNGVFQWWNSSLPLNLSFFDLSFQVLTDPFDDIILTGLSDTMIKFQSDGTELWRKSMNGLDNYISDSKITYSNFLAIGGTIAGSQGYDVKVAFFDRNGNQNWYGTYNSNDQEEFTTSIAIDGNGVYLLEDSVSTSSLIKFDSPFFNFPIDYSLVCVDSVWYEPGNPTLINVRVFNGNIQHLNYPSVQIVALSGDTISNKIDFVNFFAHLGNYFQVYQDTITVAGITDFSNYAFLIHEGFGDSTAVMNWCNILGVENIFGNSFVLFPNPASNLLNLSFQYPCSNCRVEIFSDDGKICLSEELNNTTFSSLDISKLCSGFYILRLEFDSVMNHYRFIKQ